MDILAREKAKLEVLQSSTLVLLTNSITILPYPPPSDTTPVPHPLSTHRVTLNIKYADTLFSVLVTMEHPLDFLVTTPHLLPMKNLDSVPFPPDYPNTSLVELVRWLITHLKSHMEQCIQEEEQLSGLASAIDNMISMNIISRDSYEVVLVGDKATLLVKFRPEKDIKLASLSEMVKEDKLLNTGGHFYVLKMVFRADTGAFLPGEFSIVFSSDLANMLPELANFSHPGFTAKLASNLVEFQMYVKETVDKAIMKAVDGWEKRSSLLLLLHSIFEDGEQAIPYLDSTTMSVMDLAFRTEAAKFMFKIELTPDYPAVVPKMTVFYTRTPAAGARETRDSGTMKERVFTEAEIGVAPDMDMDENEIVTAVIQLINQLCQKIN
eukprot:GFUD01027999.1.p1 GENE.GFUD01027999.1~~GFUD01027999.1.p1  ORF type:complete len:380 (+),score=138.96 GFUD01027999.1:69-1208(+)